MLWEANRQGQVTTSEGQGPRMDGARGADGRMGGQSGSGGWLRRGSGGRSGSGLSTGVVTARHRPRSAPPRELSVLERRRRPALTRAIPAPEWSRRRLLRALGGPEWSRRFDGGAPGARMVPGSLAGGAPAAGMAPETGRRGRSSRPERRRQQTPGVVRPAPPRIDAGDARGPRQRLDAPLPDEPGGHHAGQARRRRGERLRAGHVLPVRRSEGDRCFTTAAHSPSSPSRAALRSAPCGGGARWACAGPSEPGTGRRAWGR